jgi:hypothetical protein
VDYDEELPTMDDPNHTCSECKHQYYNRVGYIRPLKDVHYMKSLLLPPAALSYRKCITCISYSNVKLMLLFVIVDLQ